MNGIQNKNPNPCKCLVGDCVVRAISIAENKDWQDIYIDLCTQGLLQCDMPSSNSVWQSYLQRVGYFLRMVPNEYPNGISVKKFTEIYPRGIFVLGTGEHAIAVINGTYYDTWDSGDEIIMFYLAKKRQ